ncbi:hypothetical protein Aca07nite_65380 [Actinoplanes capillaceus]|uniref:Uncharacterized protein n=1 Tax=Actinoplanes campanulatus TaxID=113559 RepID=A0ABQ3WSW3_9ACTN|nr:hypothetical protein GCM10010109_80690 [Actinoplanes campanulatus]GID41223.1 hypothetical protein Aca09nite_77290 [Actinoplanes campanulatus]GID49263.1 hypothetical protein Aca07nite_65380 [Actinoplanes capillaceus]
MPAAYAISVIVDSSRDFPMPASPVTKTAPPRPPRASAKAFSTTLTSRSRPINIVECGRMRVNLLGVSAA